MTLEDLFDFASGFRGDVECARSSKDINECELRTYNLIRHYFNRVVQQRTRSN